MTHNLDGFLALRLRDEVRGDLERRFGTLCVSRGLLSEPDLRRGLEEQDRLRQAGEDASLVHALARLGLVDGGPLWLLLDEVLAAPSDEPPGRRLGRYELIREIGSGGTGTVYKAYDARLGRVVAVKTIKPDLAQPAELVREAQTLAGLSHKNIVAVYDAGEIDGTPFLCMEYVEGSPLGERIRRPGASREELVAMVRKIAEALAYAHARGVVHCDLKPGNILVDRDGEPRIIDFGLARMRREGRGGVGGTPAYMAPEQILGTAGPQADVYALGVCLYEALTGSRAFEGFDRDLVPPRVRRPDIPRRLEKICLKAMEPDPARRYAGAADLANALSDRPRRPWLLTAAAVLVAAVAVLVAAVAVVAIARGGSPERRDARLESMILETRPFFYIKDADVAGRLAKIRESLSRADGSESAVVGMGHYFTGDLVRAEQALLRAPDEGAVHYYLGRIYLDRAIVELLTPPGRPDAERRERSKAWTEKAADHLGRATTWEGAPELDRRIAEAGLALAKGDGAGAMRLCQEGLVRFAGKLGVEEFSRLLGVLAPPEERAAHLTRAIEFRPHFPWALLQRGAQYLQEGKPDLAIADLDRALALDPQFVYAYNDRGVAWFNKGDPDRAQADFDRVIALDPNNGLGWANRALARGAKKDLKGAIEDSTKAIALYPFPSSMVLNRGVHRLAFGDLEGALADAEEGIRREPASARGYILRGGVRSAKKDWPAALADYEKALSIDPRNIEARAGRGVARLSTDDRAGAIQDLDEAIRLQPSHAIARFNRGTMRAEDGDEDGAIEDLDAALRSEPDHQAARICRGIAWESKGEFAKAIADFDEAVRRDAACYDAYFNRGMTRLEQGNAAAAVKDLEQAIRLAPADWNSRPLALSSLEKARKGLPE